METLGNPSSAFPRFSTGVPLAFPIFPRLSQVSPRFSPGQPRARAPPRFVPGFLRLFSGFRRPPQVIPGLVGSRERHREILMQRVSIAIAGPLSIAIAG